MSITNSQHEIAWRPVADIPNQAGFALTVKRKDGELINTRVTRSGFGHHALAGIDVSDIKGWIPNTQV